MMWLYVTDMSFIFGLKIRLKRKEGLGERLSAIPLSINFRPVFYLNPGERNRQWKHHRIVSFEEPPPVSMDEKRQQLKECSIIMRPLSTTFRSITGA